MIKILLVLLSLGYSSGEEFSVYDFNPCVNGGGTGEIIRLQFPSCLSNSCKAVVSEVNLIYLPGQECRNPEWYLYLYSTKNDSLIIRFGPIDAPAVFHEDTVSQSVTQILLPAFTREDINFAIRMDCRLGTHNIYGDPILCGSTAPEKKCIGNFHHPENNCF